MQPNCRVVTDGCEDTWSTHSYTEKPLPRVVPRSRQYSYMPKRSPSLTRRNVFRTTPASVEATE